MSKRFHDTEQLDKPFFMDMPGRYKLLFNWIEKKHDTAGIWTVNLSAFIRDYHDLIDRDTIDLDEFIKHCNKGKERIVKLEGGKKIFLTTTIEFQYGSKDKPYTVLNENSPVKKGILNRLRKHKETQDWLTDQARKGKIRFNEANDKLPQEKAEAKPESAQCSYCQGEFTADQLQKDHIVPTAKGGDNYADNITMACTSCNTAKSDRDPVQFIEEMGLEMLPKLAKKLVSLQRRGKLTSLPYANPIGTGIGIGKGNKTIKINSSSNLSLKKEKEKKSRRIRYFSYDQVIAIHNRDTDKRKQSDFEITNELGPDGKKLWRQERGNLLDGL